MPLPRISRALSMISAPRRRIFFGSQPRNAHVPPYGSASTMATLPARGCALVGGRDAGHAGADDDQVEVLGSSRVS